MGCFRCCPDLMTEFLCAKCLRKVENSERTRAYRQRYPDRMKAFRESWAKRNPEKVRAKNKRARDKLRATTLGVLNHRMEVSMCRFLRGEKRGRSWPDLVGYTAQELKDHIESQFTDGMSWALVRSGAIEIDHIFPKSKCLDFATAWALKNLRPLWKPLNRLKRDRLPNHPLLTFEAGCGEKMTVTQ